MDFVEGVCGGMADTAAMTAMVVARHCSARDALENEGEVVGVHGDMVVDGEAVAQV